MSFAIVSLIILVVIALIAIPILIRVFGEAAGRNPNRPGGEGSDCHHFGRSISRSASSRQRRVANLAMNTLPLSSATRTRVFVGAVFMGCQFIAAAQGAASNASAAQLPRR